MRFIYDPDASTKTSIKWHILILIYVFTYKCKGAEVTLKKPTPSVPDACLQLLMA